MRCNTVRDLSMVSVRRYAFGAGESHVGCVFPRLPCKWLQSTTNSSLASGQWHDLAQISVSMSHRPHGPHPLIITTAAAFQHPNRSRAVATILAPFASLKILCFAASISVCQLHSNSCAWGLLSQLDLPRPILIDGGPTHHELQHHDVVNFVPYEHAFPGCWENLRLCNRRRYACCSIRIYGGG